MPSEVSANSSSWAIICITMPHSQGHNVILQQLYLSGSSLKYNFCSWDLKCLLHCHSLRAIMLYFSKYTRFRSHKCYIFTPARYKCCLVGCPFSSPNHHKYLAHSTSLHTSKCSEENKYKYLCLIMLCNTVYIHI